MIRTIPVIGLTALVAACGPAFGDQSRETAAAPVGTVMLRTHAVGAQVYECRAEAGGPAMWRFREPIAALTSRDKTVGRHLAGPSWDMADGGLVVGKAISQAPGTSPGDVPWLRLDVSEHRGEGSLKDVTTVQRIATEGGRRDGPCTTEDSLVAEPYAADYVFSRP